MVSPVVHSVNYFLLEHTHLIDLTFFSIYLCYIVHHKAEILIIQYSISINIIHQPAQWQKSIDMPCLAGGHRLLLYTKIPCVR